METSDFRKQVLDSGVTLVAERNTRVRGVSVGVWVDVGSTNEKPQTSGISHFIEHMVFKGTRTRSALDIATTLESLGGDLNAFTDRELTCYHAAVLSEYLDTALSVLSDLVIHPLFESEQIERERGVLLQEYSQVRDTPEEFIGDLFLETVWKESPLGFSVIGSRKSIQSIDRTHLKNYFNKHYRAENMVLSVAGNFDIGDLMSRASKFFSDVSKGGTDRRDRRVSGKFHSTRKSVVKNTDQVQMLLGFEAFGLTHPDRYKALVLSGVLGGGMSSRLFQKVREEAGLAYSVDCDYHPFAKAGLVSISVATSPRSVHSCLKIISSVITGIQPDQAWHRDVERVKGQLKGAILLSSDQIEARQESIGRNELAFRRYISVEEVIEEINRIQPEELFEMARSIFRPEKEAVLTLGPKKFSTRDLSLFH